MLSPLLQMILSFPYKSLLLISTSSELPQLILYNHTLIEFQDNKWIIRDGLKGDTYDL
jgi:hypothetical protein